ncbi:MAG: lamin tail domain-containing protein [Chitinophagaceae bacterium]
MKTSLLVACLLVLSDGVAGQASRNDVVIDEIMADPLGAVRRPDKLPESEFIELKNRSLRSVNLIGWRVSDASGTAFINSNFILQPDSFVIITSNGAVAALSVFGATLGVANFPSLDNNGEWISLRSKEGNLIHAVEYHQSWYQDAVKMEGGWTLEMIDPGNACTGMSNWKASIHTRGGTPGTRNSVYGTNTDVLPPALSGAFAPDSMSIILHFDEPLDSVSAVNPANYFVSDGPGFPQAATALAPLFNKILLRLNPYLQSGKLYTVRVKAVKDCSGTEIGAMNEVRVGLARLADSGDVVINELLFNPKPGGFDYVEVYNRSNHTLDLKDLSIANRAANRMISSLRQLSADNRLLFPGDYLVATENAVMVKDQYHTKNPEAFAELKGMPSYPDDKGIVVLLNSMGKRIDEVAYDEKWHFKLIANNEGVALERIDFNKASQDANNWFSAATDAGYGTPTYQNSQFKAAEQVQGAVSLGSRIFSPDNDGFDDFVTVNYRFTEPGYVCNITIFDVNGIPVRYLTRNAICGLTGYFRWDGLDEKSRKLNLGMYIMLAEVFNLKGKSKKVKEVVTLAGRLR